MKTLKLIGLVANTRVLDMKKGNLSDVWLTQSASETVDIAVSSECITSRLRIDDE